MRVIKTLALLVGAGCLVLVMCYDQGTSARREVSVLTKQVEALKTTNTALKNQLYGLIDTRTVTMQVERLGYIKDSNPAYVTLFADGSVREDGRVSLLKP